SFIFWLLGELFGQAGIELWTLIHLQAHPAEDQRAIGLSWFCDLLVKYYLYLFVPM
uniref:Uncharacterized protein n=1 Tax=Aegilops tauschii subsp. strangulata TaxID=200361 RepID=A0A452YDV6_AEGTS